MSGFPGLSKKWWDKYLAGGIRRISSRDRKSLHPANETRKALRRSATTHDAAYRTDSHRLLHYSIKHIYY